jgi:hypothetical protein
VREVTKEDFIEFVLNYPTGLDVNISHISEPPIETYNDFSEGRVFPEGVENYPYCKAPNVYKILEEI